MKFCKNANQNRNDFRIVRQPMPKWFVGDNFFLRQPVATEGDSSGKVGTLPQTCNRCMLSYTIQVRLKYLVNFIIIT